MTEPFVDPAAVCREAIKAARTRTRYIVQAKRENDEAEVERHMHMKASYLSMARTYYEEMKRAG